MIKIKKVNRLIIGSFIGPFFVTFFLTLFLFMMQFFWKWIDELIGKGVDFLTMSKLVFYIFIQFIPTALPLAILLSSIMTFGNLGEKSELTALKSAGMSFFKIAKPMMYIAFFLAAFNFYFANNIFPITYLNMRALLYDVTEKKPALNIKPMVFYQEIDGFSIRVKKKDRDGKGINDVIIYNHSDKADLKYKTNRKISAKKGKMFMNEASGNLVLKLFNGTIYENAYENQKNVETHPHRTIHFKEMTKAFDLSSFALKRTDKDLFSHHLEMMTIPEIINWSDSLKIKLAKSEARNEEYFNNQFYITRDSLQNEKKKEVVRSNSNDSSSYSPTNFTEAQLNRYNFDSLSVNEQKRIVSSAKSRVRNNKSHNESIVGRINEAQNKELIKSAIEVQRKFVVSIACLLLFFIGAPLGAIIKKGGLGLPVVFSVVFFIVYYVTGLSFEKMAKAGDISPYTGMWMSTIILSPFAIILSIAASHDISLISFQGWKELFQRVLIFKKKVKRK